MPSQRSSAISARVITNPPGAEHDIEWAPCFHGGAFFEAIGVGFDDLDRRHAIINADVLDAWFVPAPGVIAALERNLPWLIQTSPPADCAGLIDAIARARGIPKECVLPTAGSSDGIFLALRQWLTNTSRVLILDPMYGEYAHLLERVIGCKTDRFPLSREDGYEIDLRKFRKALANQYDLVVLVNPNSPTGRHVDRRDVESLLADAPPNTRFWTDETYVEYAGPNESLEQFAAASANVIVCKSMSKVYALSGLRAGYLCADPVTIAELRSISPPWSVSLPAQVAAVHALADPEYYRARYTETHLLRTELARELEQTIPGIEIVQGMANFLLCHLPEDGPTAAEIVDRCRLRGFFLRDASNMGTAMGDHAVRVAVKDRETNQRMLTRLQEAWRIRHPSTSVEPLTVG